MWPFHRKKPNRLAAASKDGAPGGPPAEVQVEVVVASPNELASTLTGMRAALFRVVVLERQPLYREGGMGGTEELADNYVELGAIMWGDTLAFRDEDGSEVTVVARRAQLGFADVHHGGTPLAKIPAEIAPILKKATGRGVLCFREHTVRQGDRYRLTATIEAVPSVVASGYRSGTGLRFIARDDLSLVKLEEIFEVPDF